MSELLLLSNSRAPGQAFLEHAADAIRSILGASTGRLFRRGVPPANVPAGTDLSFLLDGVPWFDVRTGG
jgi:hypothetical protein